MKYKLKTLKEYDFFEVASAFQKSVRRGLEEDAMYWAVELFNSGYDEYLWKRIKIISSEDIGLAEPNIAANISGLYSSYLEQKKKKDESNQPERLFLTHAVLMLCRSKKSRVVDHALIHFWRTHPYNHKQIPDCALDKHNERGRKLGRGWKHFFEEGTTLENMAVVEGEGSYRQLAQDSISSPSANLFSQLEDGEDERG